MTGKKRSIITEENEGRALHTPNNLGHGHEVTKGGPAGLSALS